MSVAVSVTSDSVTCLPLTSPYRFSKAPVSLTDQPHGPSNFTTHLRGQGEALPPAKSVYVTESVERKSIPSNLDRLYPYIITNLYCPQQSFHLCTICMILHNNTASRARQHMQTQENSMHLHSLPFVRTHGILTGTRLWGERFSQLLPTTARTWARFISPASKTTAQC